MTSETSDQLDGVTSADSAANPPRPNLFISHPHETTFAASLGEVPHQLIAGYMSWMQAAGASMVSYPMPWDAVYGLVGAREPLMINTRGSLAALVGDELVLDTDEYDDPPLERYETWQRVSARFVYGSGVPAPSLDPSDGDDW